VREDLLFDLNQEDLLLKRKKQDDWFYKTGNQIQGPFAAG
jgi:hypothetical protein